MTHFHLKNNWFILPLFALLTTYAILRSLFVEPLFDELGTFYWYIQTGLLPGKGAALDANNHILNSFISNQFYRAFGDYFVLYRLFALITFPVYFFSARYLLLQSNTRFQLSSSWRLFRCIGCLITSRFHVVMGLHSPFSYCYCVF